MRRLLRRDDSTSIPGPSARRVALRRTTRQDSALRVVRVAGARREDHGSLRRVSMAVRKQCAAKGCKSSPRCDHPWWFDVMHRGKRYRMPVDAFALLRGATQPVTSKQEAEKVWEPRFIGEIVAGKNPRKKPAPPAQTGATVSDFLDSYYDRYVVAESLRSVASIRSRLAALKASLGELPVSELERVDPIEDFKRSYGETKST